MRFFIIGGNPDGNGGGVIDASTDRFKADRLAAVYVARGYRDVRVMSE